MSIPVPLDSDIMVLEGFGKLVGSVASRHKIQFLTLKGVYRGHQGRASRHRNGANGKAGAGIGIVRCVCTKMASLQATLKFGAEAVDYRWICLKTHSPVEPVVEDTADSWHFIHPHRFLLDNGGQNQRLVGVLNRKRWPSLLPDGVKFVRHFACRFAKKINIRFPSDVKISIRKKQSLWRPMTQRQPYAGFRVCNISNCRQEHVFLVQTSLQVPKIPPFNNGDFPLMYLPAPYLPKNPGG